ncbi:MAG: glycosyltransferase family 39 protein [Promethearchaeota archaeon]
MLFINVVPSDVEFYWSTGQLLLKGYIPYYNFNNAAFYDYVLSFNIQHPNGPVNYIFYTFIVLILGNSSFAIKFPMFISEIFATILIFLIINKLLNSKIALYISLLYSLNPLSYYPMLLIGCDEIISGALTLAAIYFALNNRPYYAGLTLGVSIMYKFYSILFLIPLFFYFFRKYALNQFFKLILVFITTALIFSLPYLLICFDEFIYWNSFQLNRFITVSYGILLKNSFVYQPIIETKFFSLNTLNLIQIILVLLYIIYTLIKTPDLKDHLVYLATFLTCGNFRNHDNVLNKPENINRLVYDSNSSHLNDSNRYNKNNKYNNKDNNFTDFHYHTLYSKENRKTIQQYYLKKLPEKKLFNDLALFSVLLPIISLSTNYRYYFWTLPFLLIVIFWNFRISPSHKKQFIRYIKLTIIVNSLIMVLIYIFHFLNLDLYIPFNVTHSYYAYIPLFFAINCIWLGFFLYLYRKYIPSIVFSIASFIWAFANLFAYIAIHLDSRSDVYGNIYRAFLVIAGISVLLGTSLFIISIYFNYFTSENKNKMF